MFFNSNLKIKTKKSETENVFTNRRTERQKRMLIKQKDTGTKDILKHKDTRTEGILKLKQKDTRT